MFEDFEDYIDRGFVPPPMRRYAVPQPKPGPTPQQWNIPSTGISRDAAQEAFVLFASNHCCYNKSPAKDGVITNMEAFITYRFSLETFTEMRSIEWSHEPYHGQRLDAHSWPPPRLWDIATKSPRFFHNDKQVIKVPNTSSVKKCHDCMGMGRNPCKWCAGAGNMVCWVCTGSGSRMGGEICFLCGGRGRVMKNKYEYVYVYESSGLPADNLDEVTGETIFRDTQKLVYPVMGFPDRQVVRAAEHLVSKHQRQYSQTGRILQQRQTIELIPVTKVTYDWKGSSHEYHVYGNEFRVSADSYPATCCCTVM